MVQKLGSSDNKCFTTRVVQSSGGSEMERLRHQAVQRCGGSEIGFLKSGDSANQGLDRPG